MLWAMDRHTKDIAVTEVKLVAVTPGCKEPPACSRTRRTISTGPKLDSRPMPEYLDWMVERKGWWQWLQGTRQIGSCLNGLLAPQNANYREKSWPLVFFHVRANYREKSWPLVFFHVIVIDLILALSLELAIVRNEALTESDHLAVKMQSLPSEQQYLCDKKCLQVHILEIKFTTSIHAHYKQGFG